MRRAVATPGTRGSYPGTPYHGATLFTASGRWGAEVKSVWQTHFRPRAALRPLPSLDGGRLPGVARGGSGHRIRRFPAARPAGAAEARPRWVHPPCASNAHLGGADAAGVAEEAASSRAEQGGRAAYGCVHQPRVRPAGRRGALRAAKACFGSAQARRRAPAQGALSAAGGGRGGFGLEDLGARGEDALQVQGAAPPGRQLELQAHADGRPPRADDTARPRGAAAAAAQARAHRGRG